MNIFKEIWNAINGYKTYLGAATIIVGMGINFTEQIFKVKIPSNMATEIAIAGAIVMAFGIGHKVVKRVAAKKKGGKKK
jgi:membrane-bound ClpP family serine protease